MHASLVIGHPSAKPGTHQEAVVRAIGNIGATSRGLSALNDQKTLLNDFLDQGRSSTGDMKITAMQSASCLIGVRSTVEFDTSDIAQRVFLEIAGGFTVWLWWLLSAFL